MDLNSIINMATSALDNDRDGQLEINEIMHALGPLLGGNQQLAQDNGAEQSTQGAGFDFSSLINNMKQGGMGDIAQSWLGDGANAPISGEQLQTALGADKIDAFAQQTGMDSNQALNSLQNLLPNLVDKSSRGGELLASNPMNTSELMGLVGNLASSFFKR